MPVAGTRKSIHLKLFIITFMAIFLIAGKDAMPQTVARLLPDISIRYNCIGQANQPSDSVIEKFLGGLGFQVLNKGRLAGEKRVPYVLSLDIVAINDQKQRISFIEVPAQSGFRHIILNSPPPTHRSPELDGRLVSFVTDELVCELSKVERYENPKEALDFYNEFFTQTQGWFRQAEEMRRVR